MLCRGGYDKGRTTGTTGEYPRTETKTTTVFDEYAGCVAMGVTDDGLGLIGIQGMGVNSGFIVDLASKTKVDDMLPWIRVIHGIVCQVRPARPGRVFGAKLGDMKAGRCGDHALPWYVARHLNIDGPYGSLHD